MTAYPTQSEILEPHSSLLARLGADLTASHVSGVDYGIVANGTHDDTDALNAACTAASAAGGGIVRLPPGTVKITSNIAVPNRVGIQGAGPGRYSDSKGITTIFCTASGAGLTFGDRSTSNWVVPPTGGFEIDGDSTATQPLYVGEILNPHFSDIRVNRAAGTAILIEGAQNGTFHNVQATNASGTGIKIDFGAGGLTFISCRTSSCGATTIPALLITESYGTGPYLTVGPSQLTFLGCIFENPTSGQSVLARTDAGRNNTFINTIVNTGTADTAITNFFDTKTASYATQNMRFLGCMFSGSTTYSTGFKGALGVGEVYIGEDTEFLSLLYGFEFLGSTPITVGRIHMASVTNFANENPGTRAVVLRERFTEVMEFTRAATTDSVLVNLVSGDAGSRFRILANGQLGWRDGSDFTPDTILYRNAANELKTDAQFTVGGRLTVGSVTIRSGSGTPEGAVTAVVGSLFLRTDGGASTTLYVKESGTGNTGWVAK